MSSLVLLRATLDVLPAEARRIILGNAVTVRGAGECRTYLLPRRHAEHAQALAAAGAGAVTVEDTRGAA